MVENNIRELTDTEKLIELGAWYSPAELANLLDVTESVLNEVFGNNDISGVILAEKINGIFNKHIQENSNFEMIKNVYDAWHSNNCQFMVDTPDGFQFASRFIHKDIRSCFDLRTDNFHISCSGDHLIETDTGWVTTENITMGMTVLTKNGFELVRSNTQIEDSDVYDMTIEHEHHRYWGGGGISSHNSGKSYLVAKAIADAQQNGYMVAVIDSEQAVSQDYLKKVGVDLDPSMLMTVQVQTVEQTQDIMIEVLSGVKEEQDKLGGAKELKLMLIVDSIGMLSSNKAAENATNGHHAADMGTKAKALTNMFNQVVQKVGITESVCLITNHGAIAPEMYAQMKPKGGQCLVGGTLVETSTGVKCIESIQVGDLVRTHMNRLKPVTKLFEFDDLDVIEIQLETGQILKMTPDHKMLVDRNGEKVWIHAKNLTTTDSFVELISPYIAL